MEPIFLNPAFRSKLWGGRKLKTIFNYDIPVGKVGEAWLISAYKKDSAIVNAGKFKGQTLREIYQKHPELFGMIQAKEFPLLVKYLDANDNLSVQVHPDDEYAQKVEDDNGKAESWYVIQADPGAYLIYGHTAKTEKEFAKLVNEGKWDQLLRKVPVKAGDFFYIPAGTIHALTKGIVVIETQQSSDVTYRLYDYDRIDQKTGKKRELHTKKAIDVTNVPHVDPQICPKIHHEQDAQVKTLLESPVSPHFNLWQVEVAGQWATSLQQYPYLLVSVIAGSGQFQAAGDYYNLKLGTNFIIPNQLDNFIFTGKMSLIISSPNA